MIHKLHIVLFAHQPFFIPDDEVCWRAYSTYLPVLDAFLERQRPVTLIFSGGLLRRLSLLAPDFIDVLRGAVTEGLVNVGGSAAYHPLLPTLPTVSARLQLEEDRRIRHRCGLPDAPLFWPTELAWSYRVAQLAKDAGYTRVVVDSKSCALSDALPSWQKSEIGLIPQQRPAQRIYTSNILRLPVGDAQIEIWRRDSELAHRFVHILRTELPLGSSLVDEFHAAIAASKSTFIDPTAPALLGEDMERFLPNGLARFLELLDALPNRDVALITAEAFHEASPIQSVQYIPAGTMEGSDAMWSSTLDDRWFRDHLIRTSRRAERLLKRLPATSDEYNHWKTKLLQIQDSGFYFWPFISRTRRPFFEQLSALEQWLDHHEGE